MLVYMKFRAHSVLSHSHYSVSPHNLEKANCYLTWNIVVGCGAQGKSLHYERNDDGDECNDVKGYFFMGLLQAVAIEYMRQRCDQ